MGSTTQRGDRFRDVVVDLLEAAGIRAVAEVRSDFKKVDIVARTEDLVDGTVTLLVETKDYQGALPKSDCVEFLHEYGTLVERALHHRAWLISKGPISPDGRALIEARPNLKCFTFDELQRRLFRLNDYIEELISGYESEQIGSFYIPPFTKNDEDLGTLVQRWIEDDGADPVAIMGGYGIGKSTFAKHLAATLGRQALDDPSARVPILIPLGEVFDDQSIDGLIGKVLASRYRVGHYHFRLFEILNARGRFLVILDGFDEMKHGMTIPQFERNVAEFMKLDQGKAKILLLGRDTAFHTDVEFRSVIQGRRQTAGGITVPVTGRRAFRPIELRGFTLVEARRYVERYFPVRVAEAARRTRLDPSPAWVKQRTGELLDGSLDTLLDRPVHAQMLCEIATQPDVPLAGLSKFKLYDLFVHFLLEREVEKKGRYPGFDIATRRRFNAALAWWLWDRGMASTTTFLDIPDDLCATAVRDTRHDLDPVGLRRELIAGCLVDKGGDTIFFGHRSIQEFLVAEHLLQTDFLAEGRSEVEAAQALSRIIEVLNPEITDFTAGWLREQKPSDETLKDWIWRLQQQRGKAVPLSGIDLFARVLHDADLTPEPVGEPWNYWLHHFAKLGRAEPEISPALTQWACRALDQATSTSREMLLAAVMYWGHAIRLDRGNAGELTAALVARLMNRSSTRIASALEEARGRPNGVTIFKSRDFAFWLLLKTATFTGSSLQEGRVTLDVEALVDIAQVELGVGFHREVRPDEVRLVRQWAYCTPGDVVRAVVESGGDRVPVREFFNLADLRSRLLAGPTEEVRLGQRTQAFETKIVPRSPARR